MTPAKRQEPLWTATVAAADIPEDGLHIDIAADEPTRAALAAMAGVNAIVSLQARFDIRRIGGGALRVEGTVSAVVTQTCVVSLEPMENRVVETVAVTFAPSAGTEGDAAAGRAASGLRAARDADRAADVDADAGADWSDDAPEPLVGGVIDLGALATEFLVLGIDPYPRKQGARIDLPAAGEAPGGPFAGLADLVAAGRKRGGG